MNIRTFTHRTLPEALAEVKKVFGANAVVLHTRTYKAGGVLGIGAKPRVEVTAADGREVGRQRKREASRSPRATAVRKAQQRSASVTPEPQNAGDLIRRTYQAARAQFDQAPSEDVNVKIEPPNVAPPPQVAAELAAVRRLVEQVAASQQATEALTRAPQPDRLDDPLVEHYTALIQQEIAAELANELIRDLKHDELNDVQRSLLDRVAAMLPTDPDAGRLVKPDDNRPRTIALVGPTGVGKTTTLAKLAATFKLKQNQNVGLITADTYRIAAVEQLRTYAKIIGLPLEVVSGPDELAAALRKMAHLDAVLIDTAGRSQRNADRLDELAKLIQVARPHETHLVLSSTASQSVLMQTIERFEPIRTDRLIFTKLDEAVSCGVLLNVARKVKKPLSYITTGQEVPHQIEACESARLAEWVLRGGLNVGQPESDTQTGAVS
ncbi:MAG: flagellar biosynthesis protein FlhF [Planctomycetota bacterium]